MVVPDGRPPMPATPPAPSARPGTLPAPAAPSVPRRRSFWVGLVLVVLGALGTGIAVAGAALVLIPALSPQSLRPSGETTVELDGGQQSVWQATGRTSGGGGFTFSTNGPPTVRPADLRVTGPDGADVPVTSVGSVTETLNQGGQTWTAVAHVEVPRSGTYRVTVRSTGGPQLSIGPSLGTSFGRTLPWLAVGLVGGSLLVVGAIVMVVAAVRRSNERKRLAGPPPGVPMGPPPGPSGVPSGGPYGPPGPLGGPWPPGGPPAWPPAAPPR